MPDSSRGNDAYSSGAASIFAVYRKLTCGKQANVEWTVCGSVLHDKRQKK